MTRAHQADLEEIDLEALIWERLPKGPGFGELDVTVLDAAVQLYCKHLETLGADAQKLGRDAEAAKFQREATALKYELVGDDDDPPHRGRLHQHAPRILPGHEKPLAKGLEFYLKNLRAAKGTMRGLGKAGLADDFEEEAQTVEQRLLPLFQEQGSLPLEKPAPVGNLKELAESEAEVTERTEGADPAPPPADKKVLPIKQDRRKRKVAK